MKKILRVAVREFVATAATKGFVIGVLITPALIGMLILFLPRLLKREAPRVEGQVAVIDPTGLVSGGLRDWLAPEAIAKRRTAAEAPWESQEAPQAVREIAKAPGVGDAARQALERARGEVPQLEVLELHAGADLEREKEPLRAEGAEDGGRLALVVVRADAVQPLEPGGKLGSYDMYVRAKLDDRVEDEIQEGLEGAIVDARVRAAGLDRERVETLTRVRGGRSTTVTAQGERATNQVFNMLIPAGFMILLMTGVMTAGQSLMTTTVEEKSSRVVEILLSAVSPLELMTGKILGQMVVGFVILALYAGMGIAGLSAFAALGLVDLSLIFYLVVFYLIAYFILGSVLAAVGAAVNEMREAQSLMTPIILIMMIPWFFWLPITRDPDSTFSVVLSFVPPINTFTMLLRMSSVSPPPAWQVWLSIAIGLVSAWGAVWFAAKVFRVGLLMFGKPPNLRTLIRWVRMA